MGVYGSFQFLGERYKKNVLDSFYTWRDSAITKPMPATKLMNLMQLQKNESSNKMLWAGTAFNRYLVQYVFLPTINNRYYEW